jgi:hypothetical protein
MKTIFDKTVRDELITRISALNEKSVGNWGKMNVYQMTKHCTIWDGWILGKNDPVYRQGFLGKIFGKMALKSWVKDDKPISKNMPTGSYWIVKEKTGDVELQKREWIALIAAYEHFSNPAFIHDFFGKMTTEQIGIFAYKHSDHHLRQFNC